MHYLASVANANIYAVAMSVYLEPKPTVVNNTRVEPRVSVGYIGKIHVAAFCD